MATSDEELRLERRARREARRQRQREQNLGRAMEMHEMRLARRDAEDAGARSAASLNAAPPALNVGCSGWYYWHWRGQFYPRDLPGKDWFKYYASTFRTVELNAPFYSWPKAATVKTWLRQAGMKRNFIYTIKVNELITHQRRFVRTKTLVRDFYFIADLLGPKRMGCFLFQLPPSLRYSAAALKRILAQMDPEYRNVLEFRHRSWWNQRVFDACRDAGVIFCSTSGPRLPDQLIKTADEVYIRFHGTTQWYRHDYTKDELAIWTRRIHGSGADRVWAYFNNDRNAYAIKNAKELIRQLKRPAK